MILNVCVCVCVGGGGGVYVIINANFSRAFLYGFKDIFLSRKCTFPADSKRKRFNEISIHVNDVYRKQNKTARGIHY